MKKYLILIFLVTIISNLNAQQNVEIVKAEFKIEKKGFGTAWNDVKVGNSFYIKMTRGGFLQALEAYNYAYEYNENNAELNYKIGICYLYSIYKHQSKYYLERAYEMKPNITDDILWDLALAYQQNYMFDKAIEYLNKYKTFLQKNNLLQKNELISKKITECKTGKTLYNNPVNVIISNMGIINSKYPDYCPVISADESVLVFTSRRELVVGGLKDKHDGQYYEDIFISYNKDNVWQEPYNIGRPLNSKFHDATVGLSSDGQSMLVYKSGDIYTCNLKGDKWTSPEPLPSQINSEEIENSACFSFDGNKIYFIRGKTGNSKTSNGDIYISEKKDGEWQTAKKMSSIINTEYDEDGVFMHPDGKTLYFSSKGHNSIGGYDIFKSSLKKDGTWSEPKNLGYPINTPDNDVYFVLSADGKTGYYSSIREEGNGFTDIYKINFSPQKPTFQNSDDNLIADDNTTTSETSLEVAEEIKTVNLTLVVGNIFDNNTLDPIESIIQVFDNDENKMILETSSNSKTGKYLVTLPSGKNYGMAIKATGYLFHSENFDLPESQTYQKVTKDIPLYPIEEGSKIVLKNIFFDYDKSSLKKESFSELNRMVEFMTENSNINIEISGHTDNKGSQHYNQKLSENRAKSVVDYLVGKKIDANRLKYRGVSFNEPIASNDSEKGRQLNRRVEFKIIK